jgi:serine protease Do
MKPIQNQLLAYGAAVIFVMVGEVVGHSSPNASGTGFFITEDGYLISNYHVVKDATDIQLRTSTGNLPATVVQVDAGNDLALL